MSPSGVYQRGPSRATVKSLRTLRADEPRPAGEPRRYPDRDGYIRLRWRVGIQEYVEVREHREVMGAGPMDGTHVHHRDHDKANNDPANLVRLTPDEHAAIHAAEQLRVNIPRAIAMYREGVGTPEIGRLLGVNASNVYRRLAPFGVLRRPSEAGAIRRTVDDQRAIELHALGLNAGQIARLLDCGPDAARAALRRNGIRGRRSGRPTLEMRRIEEAQRAS